MAKYNEGTKDAETYLVVSLEKATLELNKRVELGVNMVFKCLGSTNLDALEMEYQRWSDYNRDLLGSLFSTAKISGEYSNNYDGFRKVNASTTRELLEAHKELLEIKINRLKSIVERLPLYAKTGDVTNTRREDFDMNKVFIVHGHNEVVREKVRGLVSKAGLEAVILGEQAGGALTIIEKLEAHSDVGYAIVLLTGDDLGKKKSDNDLKPRARQNVLIELGLFIGKLGRNRVTIMLEPGVEIPSDVSGVGYIEIDPGQGWRASLLKELKAAGYSVDGNVLL